MESPTTWIHSSTEIARFVAAADCVPHARWIVLAGFLREETRDTLARHGASEIVSKPLVIEQLRAALGTPAAEQSNGQRLLFF